MRKLFVSNLVSLDGYFEGPNQELDWFAVNDEFFNYARNMMAEAGAIMYGRVTYLFMKAYWPDTKDNDPVITERMNNLPKIVFSKTLKTADWGDVTLLDSINPEDVIKLKQQPGGDIVILGSGQIVSALAQLNLIDEYRIILHPVILGGGNLLFKPMDNKLDLQLVQTKTLSNGTLILYYQPAKK
jgi:dihydrofolate reductase